MKKIIITLLYIFVSTSAFAVCSITGGACSVPVNSESNSLKDKPIQNNLQNFQKKDYSSFKKVVPYNINSNTLKEPLKIKPKTYNNLD